MKRHRYLLVLVGLYLGVSLACNAFAGQPVEPGLTLPAVPGGDEPDGNVAADLPTAVIQHIAPTATLVGGLPASATPIVAEPVAGEAMLTALVDVNIRLGPGVAYARDSFLLGGETAVVLGHHPESGWWKIVCPERADGNVCWVSGGSQYTRVSNAAAADSVAAPPTPTAEPTVEATAVSEASSSSVAAGSTETETVTDSGAFNLALAAAHMVYADEGALWMLSLAADEANEPVWLTDAEDVVDVWISPNGRYAAYVMVDNLDAVLNLVDIKTGAVQTLVDKVDLNKMAPSDELAVLIGQLQWLADSESIAFNTYTVDSEGGPGVGSQEDLWTVDLDGSLTERFSAGEGGGSFAISSADAVLMGQKTAVIRTNLDGSRYETVIPFDFVNTASEFAFYPWLQWSDEKKEGYAAISSAEPFSSAEANLWRIPQDGEVEFLTAHEGNIIFSPVIWSGSGRQLAYVREMVGDVPALVVGTGDGQSSTIYAENVIRFLSWSPNEQDFVFAGPGNYGTGRVGAEPLIVDVSEGRTAVSAQWVNENGFIIAIGSVENWDFRLQKIEGPATRLISDSTTPLFDIWSP